MDETVRELLLAVQDLQRRMNNIMRPGKIIATDPQRAMVKVRLSDGDPAAGIDPFDTTWLRVLQERAGSTIDWDFPEEGEQVLVLSPGGELSGGYVGHAIYSGQNPAPSLDPNLWLRKFSDGFECSYDQQRHSLTITRPLGLDLIVKATSLNFVADKVGIKNRAGTDLIALISNGFKSVMKSLTSTMMGPQPLQPASAELPQITTQIDTFGG